MFIRIILVCAAVIISACAFFEQLIATPPIGAAPQTLQLGDALTALNNLSSFRWQAEWTLAPPSKPEEKPVGRFTTDGRYLQSSQAHLVKITIESLTKDPPKSVTLFLLWTEDSDQVWAGEDDEPPWYPWDTTSDGMFDADALADAFYIWKTGIQAPGSLVSPEAKKIGRYFCHDYFFEQTEQMTVEDKVVIQWRDLTLCVTAEQLPVWAHYSTGLRVENQEDGNLVLLDGTWELVRANDPADAEAVQKALEGLNAEK